MNTQNLEDELALFKEAIKDKKQVTLTLTVDDFIRMHEAVLDLWIVKRHYLKEKQIKNADEVLMDYRSELDTWFDRLKERVIESLKNGTVR